MHFRRKSALRGLATDYAILPDYWQTPTPVYTSSGWEGVELPSPEPLTYSLPSASAPVGGKIPRPITSAPNPYDYDISPIETVSIDLPIVMQAQAPPVIPDTAAVQPETVEMQTNGVVYTTQPFELVSSAPAQPVAKADEPAGSGFKLLGVLGLLALAAGVL